MLIHAEEARRTDVSRIAGNVLATVVVTGFALFGSCAQCTSDMVDLAGLPQDVFDNCRATNDVEECAALIADESLTHVAVDFVEAFANVCGEPFDATTMGSSLSGFWKRRGTVRGELESPGCHVAFEIKAILMPTGWRMTSIETKAR
jgi:hypothetical protein